MRAARPPVLQRLSLLTKAQGTDPDPQALAMHVAPCALPRLSLLTKAHETDPDPQALAIHGAPRVLADSLAKASRALFHRKRATKWHQASSL